MRSRLTAKRNVPAKHSPFSHLRFSPLIVLAAIVLLVGCNNDPHAKPLRSRESNGQPWQVSYRSLPDDPRSLDPQFSYDTIGHSVIASLYETLLQYHPFKTDPYELVPCLAAELPVRTTHPDGSEEYLLRLRPGLTFHDDPCFPNGIGREVLAEDIAYAFKRIADPAVESPVSATLQKYILGFSDVYEAAKGAGRFDYSRPLAGVEVLDAYSLRLKLSKPYPQILYWLAMPFTAPVPREAVQYYDGKLHDGVARPQFRFHPVGTGPFRMVEWSRGRMIRLERFDRYNATRFPTEGWSAEEEKTFRPHANAVIPFVDEVQLRIIREAIPAWLLFKQGYLDASGISKDVFNTVLSAAQELTPEYKDRGVRLWKDPQPATYFLIFNMEDPLFGANRKLRQAISAAYDEEFSNQIFRNGIDINAQQLLPPGVFGHDPQLRNPYKQHNLELAKRLMVEAGFPKGIDPSTRQPLEIALDVTADDATSRQMAEFQRSQIEQLGIRVNIVENLWERQQTKVDAGNFQLVTYGWHADYPDPENFLFLFYGANLPPGGNNHSRYRNAEFDRLYERMITMDNTPERLALIGRMSAMLNEDCVAVWLSHSTSFVLTQPWAPRVNRNPLYFGTPKYALIDLPLREQRRKEWNKPVYWPMAMALAVMTAAIAYGIFRGRQRYA